MEESFEDIYDEDVEKIIGQLEDAGVMDWTGFDEIGDRMYTIDMEKLSVEFPELYEMMLADINDDLMHLYQVGLLNITYNEDLEPLFEISEEGRKFMEENGFGISD